MRSPIRGMIALQLLGVRSLEDGEAIVLRALRAASGLEWARLYWEEKGQYQLSSSSEAVQRKPPQTVESSLAAKVLEGVQRVAAVQDGTFTGRLRQARLVVKLDSEFGGSPGLPVLGGQEGDDGSFGLDDFSTVADVCSTGLANLQYVERLNSEINVDFLTNCFNRRAFEEHLKVELVRAQRYERTLCLMLLDLDEFKEVNDVDGHQAGDHVLQKVGATLRAAFRTTDRVCRFGGDEFGVIFPETPRDEVVRLAERVRNRLAGLFPDERVSISITPSIGVAAFPQDASNAEDLIRLADMAMYKAKDSGKNQVITA